MPEGPCLDWHLGSLSEAQLDRWENKISKQSRSDLICLDFLGSPHLLRVAHHPCSMGFRECARWFLFSNILFMVAVSRNRRFRGDDLISPVPDQRRN